ncbi:hypothetical protein BsWGS_04035 [Bradybaena similaris]
MSQYAPETGPADYFPPIAALFHGGIMPSAAALQGLIVDIDAQLDSNTKQLDKCLQSILAAANNLPGARTFSTPKDGLGYMCSSHTLEKDTCYDPQQDEAVAIIKALTDSLDKNPGSEESILQEILRLGSDEGLILPLRSPSSSSISHSSSSLNMQLDTTDQLIEGKWGKLSESIQKHIIAQLLKLPPLGQNQRWSWAVIERRLDLVGGLRSLVSDDEAWLAYRGVRGQQLEQLFSSLLPDTDSENVNYKEFCCNCSTVADHIMQMLEEDFCLLSTGVFKKIGGMYHILHDMYLEKYSDEMSLLVEEIADDIRDFNKKVVKTSKSDHGLGLAKADVTPSKSHNKTGSRGSLTASASDVWATKTPVYSHSLDTMFLASSYKTDKDKPPTPKLQKQSSMAFPKDCIISLRLIAMSLLKLEDFLESLTKMTSWDVTGLPNKKVKKKSSLRGVLKPSSSPEQKRHSLNLGSSFSSSDNPLESASGSAPASVAQQSDTGPPPKIVERNRSEDKVRWDWRLIFKKISAGLAAAIETKLDMAMSTALTHEAAVWAKDRVLETASLKLVHWNDGVDLPPVVSKDTNDFIQVVDELLPLARAGMEGCLAPVRTAFIDSLGIAAKNFHLHCVTLSKDIPHKASLKQLLVIMSNTMLIRNYLQHVETSLSTEDNGKKFMSSLLKQYTELVDGLGKHLLQLHNQLVCTSVLSDADSGSWSDLKDFHEDERCSFSIQMWNFYLRGMQSDMWMLLPPRRAQTLFSSLLQDSLLLLMQRYSRTKPSFRRIKQFRYDITAILVCVSQHHLKACSSVSQYLDPGHNQVPHYSIHNQCSNLLATLAVVASPIDHLYRVFKRGYDRKLETQGSGDSMLAGSNSNWLHWIWPSLIHSGTKHYDDMQTAAAIFLHMSLFVSQPHTDWGMLLQALVMKDCSLTILLLTRACLLDGSIATILSDILRSKPSSCVSQPVPDSQSITSLLVSQSSTQSSSESDSPIDSSPSPIKPDISIVSEPEYISDIQIIVDAMVHTLAQVRYCPDALAKCIIPIIDRCSLWEMFNVASPHVNPHMKVPEWTMAIFKLMDPFIDRAIEPMLRYVSRVKTADIYIRPVISYVADLPCGCPPSYSLRDHPKPAGVKEVLSKCVQLVILEIEQCIIMLPASLCCLFSAINTRCQQQSINTSHKCVALQMLAWVAWLRLQQFAAGTDKLGPILSSEVRGHIATVADSVYHVMVHGKDAGGSKFAAHYFKTNKDWLNLRFQSITSYILDEFHSMTSTDVTETACPIFTDHIFSLLATDIMTSPKGYRDMSHVCNLVRNNSQWLLDQMDVQPPVSDSDEQQMESEFRLQLSPPTARPDFNPISEMNRIGDSAFSQPAIMEFAFDWMALLTSDLGLSRAAFRNLLMNRHEFQDGAVLEGEAEKKAVDVLRAVYEH